MPRFGGRFMGRGGSVPIAVSISLSMPIATVTARFARRLGKSGHLTFKRSALFVASVNFLRERIDLLACM